MKRVMCGAGTEGEYVPSGQPDSGSSTMSGAPSAAAMNESMGKMCTPRTAALLCCYEGDE